MGLKKRNVWTVQTFFDKILGSPIFVSEFCNMAIWTTEQYQKLCTSISDGVLTVRYSDKTVTYRSLDEMIRIKKMMEKDLGLSTQDALSKVRYTEYHKGL